MPGMLILCRSYNSGILANLGKKITFAPTRQSTIMIRVLGPIIVYIIVYNDMCIVLLFRVSSSSSDLIQ